MNREQAESLLALLVFDDLEEPARSQLLDYLKTDPELNERLGDMRLTAKLLGEAVAEADVPTLDAMHRESLNKNIERDRRKRGVLHFINGTRTHPAVAALLVISTVAILVGMLLPALGTARRSSRQMTTTSQARGIGQSMHAYVHDNDGNFPERVSQLVEGGYVDPNYLIAPGSDVQIPESFDSFSQSAQNQWIDQNSSFKLLARGEKAGEQINSDRVIGYMKHGDGESISVAFADGRANHDKSEALTDYLKESGQYDEMNRPVATFSMGHVVTRHDTPTDDLSLQQSRIDAARRKLAGNSAEVDYEIPPTLAGKGVAAGQSESAGDPYASTSRFAGRGDGWVTFGDSPAPAGEKADASIRGYAYDDNQPVPDASGFDSRLSIRNTPESRPTTDPQSPAFDLLSPVPGSTAGVSTDGYGEFSAGYGGGGYGGEYGGGLGGALYGDQTINQNERSNVVALNDAPASDRSTPESLDFFYSRQQPTPGGLAGEPAKAGAVVNGTSLGIALNEPVATTDASAEPTDQLGRQSGQDTQHWYARKPITLGEELVSDSGAAITSSPGPVTPAQQQVITERLRSIDQLAEASSEPTPENEVRRRGIQRELQLQIQTLDGAEFATAEPADTRAITSYDELREQHPDLPQITSGRVLELDKDAAGVSLQHTENESLLLNRDNLTLQDQITDLAASITEGLAPQTIAEVPITLGSRLTPTEAAPPARKPRLMPVNPWVMTADDPLSTFALDVDTASYDIARRYINDGFLPPRHTVRMEEFVNSFDYNYPAEPLGSEAFGIFAEAAPSPFTDNTVLLKVGVRGKVVGRDQAKPANLVFVVDTSGSMERDDRLPLVRKSLAMVLDNLAPNDRVSVVSYGTQANLLIEAAYADQKLQILDALENLQTGGSTNLLSGVELGYEVAQRQFITNGVNRVILNSDGVANVGPSEADQLIDQAQSLRKQGVSFTSIGFGAGNYDDHILEQLANTGDGDYLFIGSIDEAKRVFVDNMAATRPTIAYDAKIQVDFDPARVRRYRLIGYENRDIADADFRNDAIDAGEVGSGQSATALYELELIGPTFATTNEPDLGTVYVRYRDADTAQIREFESRLTNDQVQPMAPAEHPRFFLAAGAARFAEVLRGSEHLTDPDLNNNLRQVQSIVDVAASQLPLDQMAQELPTLITRAQGLPRAE